MFVLKMIEGSVGSRFVMAIDEMMMMVQGTADINKALKWSTRDKAQAFYDEWKGTGVGIEGYRHIDEVDPDTVLPKYFIERPGEFGKYYVLFHPTPLNSTNVSLRVIWGADPSLPALLQKAQQHGLPVDESTPVLEEGAWKADPNEQKRVSLQEDIHEAAAELRALGVKNLVGKIGAHLDYVDDDD